jgi:uncharacterized protein (TIGR02598 family)
MSPMRREDLGRAAFSLVEVALAIAIIGVSLVAVVGLLPPLLKSERDSGFHSLLPRLVSVATGELRSRAYPLDLTGAKPVQLRFTESGNLAVGNEEAVFLCTATFRQIPAPAASDAASGGIPDVGTDACLAILEWTFHLEPGRAPLITHATLAREK